MKDLSEFIQLSEELEAKHIEAGKLIRKLRINIGLRNHFDLPMTGSYSFRISGFGTRQTLVVANSNGHPIHEVPLRKIPRNLHPLT